MLTFIFILIAYLIGSLSSAILVCKLSGYPDPRQSGSQNPGATNVLRIANKKIAALVLFGDAFKGFLAVMISKFLISSELVLGIVGLAAILGHIFPVFFQFKGGKGVATTIGVLFALSWPLALIAIAIWAIVFAISRISSLSALIAAACIPFATWWLHQELLLPNSIISAFVLIMHHENIKRLLKGEESSFKKK